jgi:hypothetical protein
MGEGSTSGVSWGDGRGKGDWEGGGKLPVAYVSSQPLDTLPQSAMMK